MQEINLLAESPDNQYFLQTARDKTYGSLLARVLYDQKIRGTTEK